MCNRSKVSDRKRLASVRSACSVECTIIPTDFQNCQRTGCRRILLGNAMRPLVVGRSGNIAANARSGHRPRSSSPCRDRERTGARLLRCAHFGAAVPVGATAHQVPVATPCRRQTVVPKLRRPRASPAAPPPLATDTASLRRAIQPGRTVLRMRQLSCRQHQ